MESNITVKGNIEIKSSYMCKRMSSVCSRVLKGHETLKHTQRVPPKEQEKSRKKVEKL